MQNPNEFAMAGLDDAINVAIKIGLADRKAASITRAAEEARYSDPSRHSDEVPIRVASVLGDLPNKIRKAISISMTWDKTVRVPLMQLTADEYPGSIPRSPYAVPKDQLSVGRLQHAGKAVFEALRDGGMQPELDYHFNGDIRTYSLQIYITISTTE